MAPTLQGAPAEFAGGRREVARGVFAWLQPNGSWGESNAGLVVGDGASVLVDTLWDQRLARAMLDGFAADLAAAPVALVVNTHSDGDHWWGNAEVPGRPEIVTSHASLAAMREEAPPSALPRLRRLAGLAGRLPDAVPGGLGAMGRLVGPMLAPFAFDEVELRLPDRAFSGTAVESAGGRGVRLVEVGPAHTAGDLVVHVPDAGVVFAADVLFIGVTPVMWAGPVENWLAALDTILALEPEAIVPGHGPLASREDVEAVGEYWRWVSAAVAAHRDAGRDAFAAARAMVREPEFRRFATWHNPERLVINATTVHRALSGQGPVPTSPPHRARLFTQVAQLRRELDRI